MLELYQKMLNRQFRHTLLIHLMNFHTLVSSLVSIIAVVVIVPFITFFLLKDSRKIFRGIMNVMPNKYFEMSYWIIKKVSFSMGRFVRAWIFDATFVGLCCGLGFYLIGIDNALILGVIAGLGHLSSLLWSCHWRNSCCNHFYYSIWGFITDPSFNDSHLNYLCNR